MLKLVVKKKVVSELENDHHVSLEANVSQFPYIFFYFSGFSISLVYPNVLSGGYLPKTSTTAL